MEIAVQEQTILPQANDSASPLHLEPPSIQKLSGDCQRQVLLGQQTAQTIMDESSKLSRYLPCHYFDYMNGTGFGGYLYLVSVATHKLTCSVSLLSC